jgi:2-dehydro-3-deoxyphosphooctonate aldolase (KDO 8-P synthase)
MKTNNNNLFIIAGPCVVESKEMLDETASVLTSICNKFEVELIFKASYKKANRTSSNSFMGIGDELALSYLYEIKEKYKIPVLTDIHSVFEAEVAAEFVDVLQIPAFLCRQTDLLIAAGKTGKIINIKKGQFMAPETMLHAVNKVKSTGNEKVWLTERGTSFGYHDLIVDFRSLIIMKQFGVPIIFDATHSQQRPSIGEQSGGTPEFATLFAQASTIFGINGLFLETHPNPILALSDSATQLPLSDAEKFIERVLKVHRLINSVNF